MDVFQAATTQAIALNSVNNRGQTFTVGVAGVLDSVDVSLAKVGPTSTPVYLGLYRTAGGVQTGNPLATVPITNIPASLGFVNVDLSSVSLPVSLGDQLTILVTTADGGGNVTNYTTGASSANPYSGGTILFHDAGRNIWTADGAWDLAFRTYVVPSTDIAILSAQLQTSTTVHFTYQTTGNPGPFQVGVYRSADQSFDASDVLIGSSLVTPQLTGDEQTGTASIQGPFAPMPDLPYLVIVADPPSASKPKGDIIESSDTDPASNSNGNNVVSITLPDLAPAFDNPDPAAPDLLHKLLYRGQTLSIPLFLKTTGGKAIGDITIEYYLSTSSSPSVDGPGNYLLETTSGIGVSILSGHHAPVSPAATVTIPTFVVKDTYYLKTIITPTNAAQDNTLDNNIAVSDPLTVCSETNSMIGGRAAAFDSAVTSAKLNPLSPTWVISESELDARAKQVIKAAEGLRYDPYLDQLGVPTVGYGMALMDRATDGTLSYSDRARSRIEVANLVYSGVDRTFQNLRIGNVHIGTVKIRDGDVLSYKQVLALATLGKNSGPNRIGVEIIDQAQADAWFDDDYKWVKKTAEKLVSNFQQLTGEARVALISLTYQLGPGKIKQFRGMFAAIEQGDMACAGFELMNSLYADQDPVRARFNFLLLVAGYEAQL